MVESGSWQTDPRIQFFVKQKIPVHTLALGQDAHWEFLRDLAVFTGGEPTRLKDNQHIVEQFRKLVWSLRSCWIADVWFRDIKDAAAGTGAISSGPLDNVSDLGLLIYEIDPRAAGPRVTFAPNPEPRLAWVNMVGGGKPTQRTATGKPLPVVKPDGTPGGDRVSGYIYHHFDGRGFASSPDLRLDVGLTKPQEQLDIRGHFIKRGPRFRIVLGGREFFRHQPVPLEVVNERPLPRQSANRYRLTAELFPPGQPEQAVRTTLTPRSATVYAVMGQDFTAARLPSPSKLSKPVDEYQLRVTLEEAVAAGQEGLPYKHVLPVQTVAIRNAVVFEPLPAVRLTRSTLSREVTLKAKYRVPGDLPLAVKRTLPVRRDRPVPLTEKQFQFSTRPAATSPEQVTLREGEVTVVLALRADSLPEPGSYEDGVLEFTHTPATPYWIVTIDPTTKQEQGNIVAVPFAVELGTVGIAFAPRQPRPLRVGPDQAVDSQDLTVQLAERDNAAATGAGPPTIELAPADNAAVRFSEQELYVQRISVADSGRSQKLTMKGFDEPLRVCFQPSPGLHADHNEQLIGTHRYRLSASGPGLDAADIILELRVAAPQIQIKAGPPYVIIEQPEERESPAPPGGTRPASRFRRGSDLEEGELVVPPGGTAPRVRYQARMRWLPGGRLPLTIDPAYNTVLFRLICDGKETDEVRQVPYLGVEHPLRLPSVSVDPASDEGWTNLDFELHVPPAGHMPFGRYVGTVALRFQQQAFPLPFRLKVDGIFVQLPAPSPDEQKEFQLPDAASIRTKHVRCLQAFDHGLKATVEVRSELNEPLRPECLKARFNSPLLPDGSGPYLMRTNPDTREPDTTDFLPLPAGAVRRASGESTGGTLQVEFVFPKIFSAYRNQSYYGDLSFQYRETAEDAPPRDLGTTQLRIELVPFDPQELLRSRPAERQ